jgi:hypothetical protein
MDLILRRIIFGVITVVVLYLIYIHFIADFESKILLKMHDAHTKYTIDYGDLPGGAVASYSYSIWLYINDWNYGFAENKVIFSKKVDTGKSPIEVSLGDKKNTLNVNIGHSNSNSLGTNDQIHQCMLDNVPLQRWVNVITVLNNTALDIYVDGKLVKTCIIPGVSNPVPGSNIVISPDGGFSGYIANFGYHAKPLNPRDAYEIYKDGHTGSGFGNIFDRYKLKLTFLADNKEVNSLEI